MAELKSIKFPGLTDTYEVATEAEVTAAVNSALATAKANGDFKGDKGDKGDAYTLTDADKTTIVNSVIAALPTWSGGSY